MCSIEHRRSPQDLQDLLDELRASRASRKRAWDILQEIRFVLKDVGSLTITNPLAEQLDYSPCPDRNPRIIHHAQHLDRPARRVISAQCSLLMESWIAHRNNTQGIPTSRS